MRLAFWIVALLTGVVCAAVDVENTTGMGNLDATNSKHQWSRKDGEIESGVIDLENRMRIITGKRTQSGTRNIGEAQNSDFACNVATKLHTQLCQNSEKSKKASKAKAASHQKDMPNPARCTSSVLLPGLKGTYERCAPSQLKCFHRGQSLVNKKGKSWGAGFDRCLAHFGNPMSCPDGISHKGAMNADGTCVAWSSNLKKRREDCTKYGNSTVCTMLSVAHPNRCEPDSGVLIFKRVVCKNTKCEVFKVGICLRVETQIFSFYNGKQKNFEKATSKFAQKAEDILKRYKTPGKIPKKHRCRTKITKKMKETVVT